MPHTEEDHDRLVRIEGSVVSLFKQIENSVGSLAKHTDESFSSLRRELFGNGSPGICTLSRAERAELFRRVNRLEAEQNRQRGMMVLMGSLAAGVVSVIIETFLRLFKS